MKKFLSIVLPAKKGKNMKKFLSVALTAVLLCTAMFGLGSSAGAAEATYYLTGDAGLCGLAWDQTTNPLTPTTFTSGGITYDYEISLPDIAAGTYAFKVTDGTGENFWGANGGQNYSITLTDTSPVTIYFDSVSKAIFVVAQYLYTFSLDALTVVGNGSGDWLNGSNWDSTDTSNDMTKIRDGVYQITYTDIPAASDYRFWIIVNHSWQISWNSDGTLNPTTYPDSAVINDGASVTITIDVNSFNFDAQTGNVSVTFETTGGTAPTPAGSMITTAGGSQSTGVTGNYAVPASPAVVYNVDIAWGNMTFTYTDASKGVWNPDTLSYDNAVAAAWTCGTDANKITVTSHSNTVLGIRLAFNSASGYESVTAAFSSDSAGTAPVSLIQLETAAAYNDGAQTVAASPRTGIAYLNITGGAMIPGDVTTAFGSVTVTIIELS